MVSYYKNTALTARIAAYGVFLSTHVQRDIEAAGWDYIQVAADESPNEGMISLIFRKGDKFQGLPFTHTVPGKRNAGLRLTRRALNEWLDSKGLARGKFELVWAEAVDEEGNVEMVLVADVPLAAGNELKPLEGPKRRKAEDVSEPTFKSEPAPTLELAPELTSKSVINGLAAELEAEEQA